MGHTGTVAASRAHGQWLRLQRQDRGWSVTELRRRLREAARNAGDSLPDNDCLTVMIHRWENNRSGMSERYRLHFCRAFQIPIEEFGKIKTAAPRRAPDGQAPPLAALAATAAAPALALAVVEPTPPAIAAMRLGYRSDQAPSVGRS